MHSTAVCASPPRDMENMRKKLPECGQQASRRKRKRSIYSVYTYIYMYTYIHVYMYSVHGLLFQ